MKDEVSVQQAKSKLVSTYDGYRTILLCPICNHELRFINKKTIQCPKCNTPVARGLHE